jgi:hypothetical protein
VKALFQSKSNALTRRSSAQGGSNVESSQPATNQSSFPARNQDDYIKSPLSCLRGDLKGPHGRGLDHLQAPHRRIIDPRPRSSLGQHLQARHRRIIHLRPRPCPSRLRPSRGKDLKVAETGRLLIPRPLVPGKVASILGIPCALARPAEVGAWWGKRESVLVLSVSGWRAIGWCWEGGLSLNAPESAGMLAHYDGR